MHSKWVFKHFRFSSSKRNIVLALLWGGGLLAGILLCVVAPFDPKSTLYDVMCASPSLLSLFLVCVLPVLVTTVAVSTSLFSIVYVLVLLSAITHSFSGTAIYLAVGNAAWIVRPMLLFSAGGTSVLMWWLLLQRSAQYRGFKPACLALCLSCLIYILDLFLLSPFVGDLSKVI